MNSTKKLFMISASILLLVALFITGSAQSSPAATKPIILRFSTGLPPLDLQVADMQWFAEEVKKRTGGRVIIEVYPGAQLYAMDATAEAVIMGSIEMGQASPAITFTSYNPVFDLTNVYFLWRGRDHFKSNLEDYRELLAPLYQKTGVKLLHFFDRGEGGIISNKPIREVGDFKGLIIRGPTSADWQAIELLGGTPARIAPGEMYDALAKGSIHGIRTSLSGMVSFKLHEIASYILAPTMYSVFASYINLNVWNNLPKDLQDIILEVSRETEARSSRMRMAQEDKTLKVLGEACEIHTPTAAEVKQFQDTLKPLIDKIVADADKAGYGQEARRFLEIAGR